MERIKLFDGMIFGRDETSDIIVNDESVSGSHFKVMIIDYELYIVDLDSSNNTFLNDVAIIANEQIKISPKDVLRIGEFEYSYSNGAVRKLDLPSLSHTLKVDRLQMVENSPPDIERMGEEENVEEESFDDLSLSGVEIHKPKKQETGLKALRSAKKYLDELDDVRKEIDKKTYHLKKMRRRKIEVGAKVDRTEKILAESEYDGEKDYEKELRIHRGTVEGFKMKIKLQEKEIAKVREIIAKAEAEIAQAKFNIAGFEGESKNSSDQFEMVNREYDIFKNKNVFINEFETLKETIGKYERLDLDGKKEEVESEIKLRIKQYKEMQNHFGAKINSEMIKKKASSE